MQTIENHQDGETDRRAAALKLLAAVAVVQVLFWLAFDPIFIHPTSGSVEPYTVSNPQIAELEAPEPELLPDASYTDLPDDAVLMAPRGYGAFKVTVDIPQVPETGVGLLENGPGDNILVIANGQQVYGEGEMALPYNSYDHLTRKRVRIPTAALSDGENTIEIIHTQELGVEYVPGLPLVAEYKSVERAFGWKQFLMNEARVIASAQGFLTAFFALVALLRAEARRTLFWLFVVSLLWPLRNIFQLWPDIPLHGSARPLYYGLVTLGLAAAWPMLVDAWTDRSSRIFGYLIAAVFGVAAILIGYWAVFSADPRGFTHIEGVLDITGLLLIGATLARIVWHFVCEKETRYWEAAMLVLLASLMALFLLNTLIWDRHVGYLNLGQPLFLVAFALAYFSRNFRLFRSSSQLNAHLAEQLDAKTAELQAAHEREKEFVRSEAHGHERQRIMRDMHDGLGSNLMSMLLAARRGEAKPDKVAEGLQSVIDEMRLMIDSMDSVGDSLASALATFRERTQSRVENAGFAFEWHDQSAGALPALGPRKVLQIFRVMQEAVTNALKHSQGSQILVKVSAPDTLPGRATISIQDDGAGLRETRVVGHGLDNMKARAEAIGAEFEILNSSHGVEAKLHLPTGS
jgi:signal transduction histidine kinase